MRRPIQVRSKCHPFFRDLAQFSEAENLKSARVRKNGAIPCHEPMQSAHLANRLHSRPQIKMIGIAQQDLDAKVFQHILRYALDRTQSPHRHKYRGLDFSMRSYKPAGSGSAAGRVRSEEHT